MTKPTRGLVNVLKVTNNHPDWHKHALRFNQWKWYDLYLSELSASKTCNHQPTNLMWHALLKTIRICLNNNSNVFIIFLYLYAVPFHNVIIESMSINVEHMRELCTMKCIFCSCSELTRWTAYSMQTFKDFFFLHMIRTIKIIPALSRSIEFWCRLNMWRKMSSYEWMKYNVKIDYCRC